MQDTRTRTLKEVIFFDELDMMVRELEKCSVSRSNNLRDTIRMNHSRVAALQNSAFNRTRPISLNLGLGRLLGSERTDATTEAKNANLTRAAIYAFLSRAFKSEVDKSFLEKVIAIEPTVKLLSESQEEEDLKEASRLLHEFVQHVKERQDTEEHLIGDLAVEYASLFLGVSPNTVHLVESVYLGKDHLLYEKPYHEVLQAYRSLGFEKEEGFPEPEDHIAVEFEFMANLCRGASQKLEKGDIENSITYLNLQKEFLRDHVMKWVPELCQRLKGAATSTFYKAIAYMTSGFILLDNEMPDHLTEILKNAS